MRTLMRALLVLVVVGCLGFLVLGYWTGSTWRGARPQPSSSVGTTGVIDTEKARERGAEIGERAAVAAAKVQHALADTSLTAKIKAKMALDDLVKASTIDVTTNGSVVTVSGTVRSAAERDRAIALARETAGVSRAINQLVVAR